MEYYIYRNDELAHHGIKGMRWGIRRFQNKDGSLTPAGKKRRAKLEGELEKLGGGKKSETEATPRKKTASEMTDDELAKAINRARMEDTYRQLRPEPKPAEKNAFAKQLVKDVVKPAMIDSGRKLLNNSMNSIVENLTKGKVDPNSYEALKKTYEKLDLQTKINRLKNNPDGETNWENMIKKQTYETNKADREARMKGYKDAIDEAVQTRSAEKTEEARAANEAKSREYYDSTYSRVGGERTNVRSNESQSLVPATGKNYVSTYGGWNSSYSSVSKSSSVSTGSAKAASIIDQYGNEFILPDDY